MTNPHALSPADLAMAEKLAKLMDEDAAGLALLNMEDSRYLKIARILRAVAAADHEVYDEAARCWTAFWPRTPSLPLVTRRRIVIPLAEGKEGVE